MLKYKKEQDLEKVAAGDKYYYYYGMVIAQPEGRPYEERYMEKKLKSFLTVKGYPEVVFHSLRHLSTQVKLKASSGDIKAVQKETGHATSKMVTEQYSDSYIPNKQKMAEEVEKAFFASEKREEGSEIVEKAISCIKKNPELAAIIVKLSEHQS